MTEGRLVDPDHSTQVIFFSFASSNTRQYSITSRYRYMGITTDYNVDCITGD